MFTCRPTPELSCRLPHTTYSRRQDCWQAVSVSDLLGVIGCNIVAQSGGLVVQWLSLCTLDQKPKDYGQLSNGKRNQHDLRNNMTVRWQEYESKTTSQISKTSNYQQDTQNSGKETRSIYKEPEGKKPKPPECRDGGNSVATQFEEHHCQSLQLMLVEY